jgi:hypothetical protein
VCSCLCQPAQTPWTTLQTLLQSPIFSILFLNVLTPMRSSNVGQRHCQYPAFQPSARTVLCHNFASLVFIMGTFPVPALLRIISVGLISCNMLTHKQRVNVLSCLLRDFLASWTLPGCLLALALHQSKIWPLLCL